MKETTRKRKKAIVGFREACGKQWILEQLYRIYESGKQGFDSMMMKLGKMMAETIMYIDRGDLHSGDTILNSPFLLSSGRVFAAVTICTRPSPISPQNWYPPRVVPYIHGVVSHSVSCPQSLP
jgi:hypothetical protein